MELDSTMNHSGSMENFTSYPSATGSAPRRTSDVTRALAVVFGLPILICCFASFTGTASAQVALHCSTPLSSDTTDSLQDKDGDGLDDALELGQNSLTDRADSDNDGWNDAEELARGSLATAYSSQPPERQLVSIGGSAYMRAGKLHVAFASYIRSGSLANANIEIGVLVLKRMVPLAPATYAQHLTVTTVPSHTPGELVMVMDLIVPNIALVRSGKMSVYAKLSVGDFLRSAAAINMVMQGNTPVILLNPSQVAPGAVEQLGPGLLHRPLGGTTPPITWSSGEICFQQVEAVGSHGAMVTQEVSSASCVSGWDGYCDGASCSSSVGTTVDLVDPAALIGG